MKGQLLKQRTVRRTAMLGFVVVLALLPLAPASAASVGQVPRSKVPFVPSDCPIGAVDGVRIDCGYLTVAELFHGSSNGMDRLGPA